MPILIKMRVLFVAIAACCVGCAFMCYYHETGQLVSSTDAQKHDAPPLADVVDRAIKPLGFSDPEKVHLAGYPVGCPNSRACVPDRDFIDFHHVDPGFFGRNAVLVRVVPADNRIYITDFTSDATRTESQFVKSVRESIQQHVASAYDKQINIAPTRLKLKESMACPLERGF